MKRKPEKPIVKKQPPAIEGVKIGFFRTKKHKFTNLLSFRERIGNKE